MELEDSKNQKKRDISFDAAKGLAIFSVVLIHSINFLRWSNPILSHVIVSFYMPIFFLISGYFGYNSKYGAKAIIAKRFKELIIPYLTIGLAINLFGAYLFGYNVLDHYILDESKGGFWFLVVLFFCFVFFAIAKKLNKDNYKELLSLMILVYLCFFILAFLLPSWAYDAFSLPSFRKYLPFFIMGLFLRKKEHVIHPWSKNILIGSGIIYLSLIWIPVNKTIAGMVLWSICALGGCLFIINIFKCFPSFSKLFSFWGRFSLTIYIYHYIIMYILKVIIPPLSDICYHTQYIPAIINTGFIILAIAVTSICAYIGRLCDNWKFKTYLGL